MKKITLIAFLLVAVFYLVISLCNHSFKPAVWSGSAIYLFGCLVALSGWVCYNIYHIQKLSK